ncbi:MAG: LysR family transcriptional regulator [Burkholderiales bacterium]|jgi:molybdate transport system regulatory protein|nr:LysR family transcriptional regulator [Burkholderiales bacterium]
MSPSDCSAPIPKVRLEIKQGTAIGPGKAKLLEALARTGSISAAARDMDMSYRRAWLLASSLNRAFKEPLVEASKGGSGGGGALLTPLGYEVLRRYRRLEQKAMRAIEADMRVFNTLLREGGEAPSDVFTDDSTGAGDAAHRGAPLAQAGAAVAAPEAAMVNAAVDAAVGMPVTTASRPRGRPRKAGGRVD